MATLSQAHHDWVKDTFNVDPQVFTAPNEDIEQELTSDLLKQSKLLTVDTAPLFKDFSNSVHSACKHARAAMGDLYGIGAIAWNPSDASGGGKVLAKSGPALTAQDRALLENDAATITQAIHVLTQERDSIDSVVRTYEAAASQFNSLPKPVDAPPPPDPDWMAENGDVLEHVWDFVNAMSQFTGAVANINLFAGLDLIKDVIKGDQTQKQIDAINAQLDTHREAINGIIASVSDRAAKDVENAIIDYGKKIDGLKEQMDITRGAVVRLSKHVAAFTAKKGGKVAGDKDAEKVRQTFAAIVQAATASKIARKALNTKTLGPGAYKTFADQMIPLGKPITDDAKTGGASLFHKGGTLVKYTTTAAVTEALASGLEDVVSVYEDAPKIDQWYASWMSAVSAAP